MAFNPLEELHLLPGIDPIADAFSGTVNTDIVEVQGEGVLFVIGKGVGTTGTSVITVDACSTIGAAATTAIAFNYRASTTPDTWGDVTAATATGFTTTAGSSQRYMIDVPAANVGATGYAYVRLTATESAVAAVLGYVDIYVYGLRYAPQPSSLID